MRKAIPKTQLLNDILYEKLKDSLFNKYAPHKTHAGLLNDIPQSTKIPTSLPDSKDKYNPSVADQKDVQTKDILTIYQFQLMKSLSLTAKTSL
jgi:hypothetical protein